MKRHLTEKELIKYKFKLVSPSRDKEISDHIKTCIDCSRLLEQLECKFSALDLLHEDTSVSDELISKTIQHVRIPAPPRIVLFRKSAWITAAAAVLIIGSMLLTFNLVTSKKNNRELALKESAPLAQKPMSDKPSDMFASADSKAKAPVAAMSKPAKLALPAETESIAADADVVSDVPEKPPFAPASAIELVTLPRRDNVQITIYNSADLTLVRERRNLTLKKGWNWLQFMWANTLIDPTSLNLAPLEQPDKIDIQQLVFPARLKDIGRWLIKSQIEGQIPFEITYFTSGLHWRAFYMGTLSENEQKMNLQAYVRVSNNSGEDYENTQTRLIVGKVHQLDQIADLAKRQYPYDRPVSAEVARIRGLSYADNFIVNDKLATGFAGDMDFGLKVDNLKKIIKEGLSEYFLYTIEGTETIPDKWGKRLQSFDVNDIKVKSLYKYDEERWGKQTIRFISFANDKLHNLGNTPLPNGNVKIYSQIDDANHLSYIGGTDVKYIPVDEKVELNLGSARLVSIEPVLMDFKTAQYVFDKKGNIVGFDEIQNWKIEITNTSNLPVEIEITRGINTSYWTLKYTDKDVSYAKHDATHARFIAKLEPQTKHSLLYTVTTCHGQREESLKEETEKIENSKTE